VLSNNEVTLSTSIHTPGTYTVTVINVKDLAGNVIVPPNNTANYEYQQNTNQGASANLKIILEGAYNGFNMFTMLNDQSLLPLSQPYNTAPWNYYGPEQVSVIPADVVEWVLLEVRAETSFSTMLARRAAFLRRDGRIIDIDGSELVQFPGLPNGPYYIVVRHRNHLPVMSAIKIELTDSPPLYDFTTSQSKAYGNSPMKTLTGGKFGLCSADGNGDGKVDFIDFRYVWRNQNGSYGYLTGDFSLDGGVNIKDKNAFYRNNFGLISQVPN
jgi:hypothetical protein